MAVLLSSSHRRISKPLIDTSPSAINANLRALLARLPDIALLFRHAINNASTVAFTLNTFDARSRYVCFRVAQVRVWTSPISS